MLFDSNFPSFRARIKPGAPIGLDFRYYSWPDCMNPRGIETIDPDMEFTCKKMWGGRDTYEARAFGFGGKCGDADSYGNGTIFVEGLKWLDVIDGDAREEASFLSAAL